MASTYREYAQRKEGLTRFLKPESPCYDDSGLGGRTVLFPFSYSNGKLDISYSGNTFEADMVITTGIAPSAETDTAVRILSGPYLVTSLGDNFKEYIRSWRSGAIDPGSPINIYINPQVIRVQEAQYSNVDANSGNSYKISTTPPASDTYPTGSVQNTYQAKYVFKTPLTFTIVEGGITQYITFRSILDQE
jgi:hypothetical protein